MGDKMITTIYIDSNVWNFLFIRKINIAQQLPFDKYEIRLVREIEMELPTIESDLKEFIEKTIKECDIKIDIYFGWKNDRLPADQQRVAGFGVGRWARPKEIEFIKQQRKLIKSSLRPNHLYKNEADVAIAARSFYGVVLTLDRKKGPIQNAYNQGGSVIYLNEFDSANVSLRDYIERN